MIFSRRKFLRPARAVAVRCRPMPVSISAKSVSRLVAFQGVAADLGVKEVVRVERTRIRGQAPSVRLEEGEVAVSLATAEGLEQVDLAGLEGTRVVLGSALEGPRDREAVAIRMPLLLLKSTGRKISGHLLDCALRGISDMIPMT